MVAATQFSTVYDVEVDAAGNLYVATAEGILYRPAGGTAFANIDTHSVNDLAIDSAGAVYTVDEVGVPKNNNPNAPLLYHWIVRKRAAGATDFVTIDDYTAGGIGGFGKGINVVESGPAAGIYAIGAVSLDSTGSTYAQSIRKSGDGGATWTTVNTFTYDAGTARTTARHVVGAADGRLYAVGTAQQRRIIGFRGNKPVYAAQNDTFMLVRQSSDGGASWATVDVTPTPGWASEPFDADVDLDGNLYVAGEMMVNLGDQDYGFVRTNSGGSWQQVDSFAAAGVGSTASSVAIGPAGSVFVSGYAKDAGGVHHAIIRGDEPSAAASGFSPIPISSVDRLLREIFELP
jgi:hypothetical protein